MKKISTYIMLLVLGIPVVTAACAKSSENERIPDTIDVTFKNPVFEPILADPSVVRDPKTGLFYAYGTQDDWADGAGSRLIPVLRSTDLTNWKSIGQAFASKPSWKSNGGLWAPEVVLVNGKYHLYYAYSTWGDPNPGVGVAIAEEPQGPFVDKGKLFLSKEVDVPNSIDPFYWEEEGKKFLFWGSFSQATNQGTYGIPLSNDGLVVPDLSKKFKVAAGDFEAVVIHKRNGYYYFIGSKGSCCEGAKSTYHVLVGRSNNLEGPYLDKEGNDLKERGNGTLLLKGNQKFVGTGHTSRIITDDNNTDWILLHGIDANKGKVSNGTSRRVLLLEKIIWENGWPVIDGNTVHVTIQNKPVFNSKKK